jgi:hypothetical protein
MINKTLTVLLKQNRQYKQEKRTCATRAVKKSVLLKQNLALLGQSPSSRFCFSKTVTSKHVKHKQLNSSLLELNASILLKQKLLLNGKGFNSKDLSFSSHGIAHIMSAAKTQGLNSNELNACSKQTNKVFYNYTFDKGRIKTLVSWSLKTYGEYKTINLLENLKKIGFEYATKAGISLGIEDLKIPPKKALLLYEAEEITKKATDQYNKAEITGVERFQRLIDTWHRTSEQLKQEVIDNFEKTDILNPVYMMAFSGARGNISQVRQLVGMRGLMADPKGQIIDYPIRSNFREGLTLTEYIISCYGARKGIVDTALRTATAGYLTRRLVDVAQHVVISNYDCGTKKGIFLTDLKEGNKTIYSLQTRLVGRVLARDVYKSVELFHSGDLKQSGGQKAESLQTPLVNQDLKKIIKIKLASRNQEISADLAFELTQHANTTVLLKQNRESSKKVFVRSPLTCETKKSICQLCYGWSLAQGNLVSIGEAVGIVAAQSIGEPGTQLTMRTFHTGGVFSGDISDQIRAPYKGNVHYFDQIAGTFIRTPEGKMAFLTKVDGSLCVYNQETEISKAKVFKIPAYTILYFKNAESVIEKQVIAQISTIARQQNMREDSELTVKSQLQGQFFVKTLQVQENYIGPKVKESVLLKQNRALLGLGRSPSSSSNKNKSEKTVDNQTFDKDTTSNPLLMTKVMTAWDWGYAWILSCKLYKIPIFSNTEELKLVPQFGDFVDRNSIMSKINWILPSHGGYINSVDIKQSLKLKTEPFLNRSNGNLSGRFCFSKTVSLVKASLTSSYATKKQTTALPVAKQLRNSLISTTKAFVKTPNNIFKNINIKKNLLNLQINKITFNKTGYFIDNSNVLMFLPTNLKGVNSTQNNFNPRTMAITSTSSYTETFISKNKNMFNLFKPTLELSNFFGIQVFPKNSFVKGTGILTSETAFSFKYKGLVRPVSPSPSVLLKQNRYTKGSRFVLTEAQQTLKSPTYSCQSSALAKPSLDALKNKWLATKASFKAPLKTNRTGLVLILNQLNKNNKNNINNIYKPLNSVELPGLGNIGFAKAKPSLQPLQTLFKASNKAPQKLTAQRKNLSRSVLLKQNRDTFKYKNYLIFCSANTNKKLTAFLNAQQNQLFNLDLKATASFKSKNQLKVLNKTLLETMDAANLSAQQQSFFPCYAPKSIDLKPYGFALAKPTKAGTKTNPSKTSKTGKTFTIANLWKNKLGANLLTPNLSNNLTTSHTNLSNTFRSAAYSIFNSLTTMNTQMAKQQKPKVLIAQGNLSATAGESVLLKQNLALLGLAQSASPSSPSPSKPLSAIKGIPSPDKPLKKPVTNKSAKKAAVKSKGTSALKQLGFKSFDLNCLSFNWFGARAFNDRFCFSRTDFNTVNVKSGKSIGFAKAKPKHSKSAINLAKDNGFAKAKPNLTNSAQHQIGVQTSRKSLKQKISLVPNTLIKGFKALKQNRQLMQNLRSKLSLNNLNLNMLLQNKYMFASTAAQQQNNNSNYILNNSNTENIFGFALAKPTSFRQQTDWSSFTNLFKTQNLELTIWLLKRLKTFNSFLTNQITKSTNFKLKSKQNKMALKNGFKYFKNSKKVNINPPGYFISTSSGNGFALAKPKANLAKVQRKVKIKQKTKSFVEVVSAKPLAAFDLLTSKRYKLSLNPLYFDYIKQKSNTFFSVTKKGNYFASTPNNLDLVVSNSQQSVLLKQNRNESKANQKPLNKNFLQKIVNLLLTTQALQHKQSQKTGFTANFKDLEFELAVKKTFKVGKKIRIVADAEQEALKPIVKAFDSLNTKSKLIYKTFNLHSNHFLNYKLIYGFALAKPLKSCGNGFAKAKPTGDVKSLNNFKTQLVKSPCNIDKQFSDTFGLNIFKFSLTPCIFEKQLMYSVVNAKVSCSSGFTLSNTPNQENTDLALQQSVLLKQNLGLLGLLGRSVTIAQSASKSKPEKSPSLHDWIEYRIKKGKGLGKDSNVNPNSLPKLKWYINPKTPRFLPSEFIKLVPPPKPTYSFDTGKALNPKYINFMPVEQFNANTNSTFISKNVSNSTFFKTKNTTTSKSLNKNNLKSGFVNDYTAFNNSSLSCLNVENTQLLLCGANKPVTELEKIALLGLAQSAIGQSPRSRFCFRALKPLKTVTSKHKLTVLKENMSLKRTLHSTHVKRSVKAFKALDLLKTQGCYILKANKILNIFNKQLNKNAVSPISKVPNAQLSVFPYMNNYNLFTNSYDPTAEVLGVTALLKQNPRYGLLPAQQKSILKASSKNKDFNLVKSQGSKVRSRSFAKVELVKQKLKPLNTELSKSLFRNTENLEYAIKANRILKTLTELSLLKQPYIDLLGGTFKGLNSFKAEKVKNSTFNLSQLKNKSVLLKQNRKTGFSFETQKLGTLLNRLSVLYSAQQNTDSAQQKSKTDKLTIGFAKAKPIGLKGQIVKPSQTNVNKYQEFKNLILNLNTFKNPNFILLNSTHKINTQLNLQSFVLTYNLPSGLFDYQFKKVDVNLNNLSNSNIILANSKNILKQSKSPSFNAQLLNNIVTNYINLSLMYANKIGFKAVDLLPSAQALKAKQQSHSKLPTSSKSSIINTYLKHNPSFTNKPTLLALLHIVCFELNLVLKFKNYKYGLKADKAFKELNAFKSEFSKSYNNHSVLLKQNLRQSPKSASNVNLSKNLNMLSSSELNEKQTTPHLNHSFFNLNSIHKFNATWFLTNPDNSYGFAKAKPNHKHNTVPTYFKTRLRISFDNINYALNSLANTSFLSSYAGEIIKQPNFKNNKFIFPMGSSKANNKYYSFGTLEASKEYAFLKKQAIYNNKQRCLILTKKDLVTYTFKEALTQNVKLPQNWPFDCKLKYKVLNSKQTNQVNALKPNGFALAKPKSLNSVEVIKLWSKQKSLALKATATQAQNTTLASQAYQTQTNISLLDLGNFKAGFNFTLANSNPTQLGFNTGVKSLRQVQSLANTIQTKNIFNSVSALIKDSKISFAQISPAKVGTFIVRGNIAQKSFNYVFDTTDLGTAQNENAFDAVKKPITDSQKSVAKVYSLPGQIVHVNTEKITIRKAQPIFISAKSTFHALHGDFVQSKEHVITLIYQKLKTGDIIQGIPKVEQFFEARTTKRGRLFRENLPNLLKGLFIKYYVYSLKLLKQGFTETNTGMFKLSARSADLRFCFSKTEGGNQSNSDLSNLANLDFTFVALQWAVKQSFYKIQQIAVDGVLRVYRSQGVTISDKHLEIIVKQMTTKVRVIHSGQTGFFPGELVDLDFVETLNQSYSPSITNRFCVSKTVTSAFNTKTALKPQQNSKQPKPKPIAIAMYYEPVILGITKASLQVDSFLSSASFQQTSRILSQSALFNKKDFLKGVKENVMLGNLMPAGTGYLVSVFD